MKTLEISNEKDKFERDSRSEDSVPYLYHQNLNKLRKLISKSLISKFHHKFPILGVLETVKKNIMRIDR